MRALYYLFKFAEYRHEQGLSLFADRILAALLREYSKLKESTAPRIAALRETRKSLTAERDELSKAELMSYEEALKAQAQVRFEQKLYWALVLMECGLNYIPLMIDIPGKGWLRVAARAGLSFCATAASAVVAEKFIDEMLHRSGQSGTAEASADQPVRKLRKYGLGVLLACIEVAIWGLASVRAADLEGSSGSKVLTIGLVLLSIALPFAAGWVQHDRKQRQTPVRRTLRLRAIDDELVEVAKALANELLTLEARWEVMAQEWYSTFASFRAYKEVRNKKQGITEEAEGRIWETRDTFCAEAKEQRDKMYGEAALSEDALVSAPANEPAPLHMNGRSTADIGGGLRWRAAR